LIFFNILFFQHTNNSKSDLINCSSPKPLQPMTLAIDAIESTKDFNPNIQLLSIHNPFILHDTTVGVFFTIVIALRIQCFHQGDILESKCNCHFPSSLGHVDPIF